MMVLICRNRHGQSSSAYILQKGSVIGKINKSTVVQIVNQSVKFIFIRRIQMKRITLFTLFVVLAIALTGCLGGKSSTPSASDLSNAQTTIAKATAANATPMDQKDAQIATMSAQLTAQPPASTSASASTPQAPAATPMTVSTNGAPAAALPQTSNGQPLINITVSQNQSVGGMPASGSGQSSAPANNLPAANDNGNAYQGTADCKDGSSLDNVFANISRIPLGNKEGASVYEISWQPGTGFGGYDRMVLVLPRMDTLHMGFVDNASTVHGLRYCGYLSDILAYAPTHVTAIQQSSQDASGNRPSTDEIPVVFMKLDGSLVIVKDAPLGPSLDTIKAHLEMTPKQ